MSSYGFEEQLQIVKLKNAEQLSRKEGDTAVLYDDVADEVDSANKPPEGDEQAQSTSQPQASSQTQQSSSQAQPDAQSQQSQGSSQGSQQQQSSKQSQDKPEDKKDDKQQQSTDDKKQVDKDKPEKEEENDKPQKSEKEQIATESINNFDISMEGIKEVWETGSRVVGPIADAIKFMGYLGITYGPKIAKFVYHNVIVNIGRMIALLFNSILRLTEYIKRHVVTFEKLQNDITNLKQALVKLQEKEEKADPDKLEKLTFTNSKVCGQLAISGNTDLNNSVNVMHAFVDDTIKNLSSVLKLELQSIDHLLSMSANSDIQKVNTMMKTKLFSPQMVRGTKEGYASGNENVEEYFYKQTLPGNAMLFAWLPSNDTNSLEDFKNAYAHAKLFLGVDTQSCVPVKELHYMGIEDLISFLDQLSGLVTLCQKHQAYYEEIAKHQGAFRYRLKAWIAQLFDTREKVSMKDTLIDYIQMKLILVDKVYVPAAIDIHDFAVRFVGQALNYTRENIKLL